MTRSLYIVARRCAEHWKLVIALWVLALLLIGGANKFLGGSSVETIPLSGTDSATAQTLLGQVSPGSSTQAVPIVFYNSTVDFGSGSGEASINSIGAELKAMPEVAIVSTPSDNPKQLSQDHHTALINVTFNDSSAGQESVMQETLDKAQAGAPPGTEVAMGGIGGTLLSQPKSGLSEGLGLLAALIVLSLFLRRFAAIIIPLINAMVAVGIGLAVISLLGRVVFIPNVATTLGSMLGLGVGIDYALFLVTRHRKLLQDGYSVPDAAGRTMGTAGAGIVFAGSTLVAAVCGLALTGLAFLAWLGFASAIVIIIAGAASITLVPAMLGAAQRRVLPKKMQQPLDEEHHEILDRSIWARLATAVTTKPWRFAIISTLVLLVLAAPAMTLSLGMSDASDLPQNTTGRQASDLMTNAFGAGSTSPLVVVVEMYTVATPPPGTDISTSTQGSNGTATDPRTKDPRLTNLEQAIAATPGVVSVNPPIVSTDGGVAIIVATPQWSGSDTQTAQLVTDLRTDVIPAATADQGMAAYVGGVTALTRDLYKLIAERTPFFIFGVVLLAFFLLMIAYRSLLIPIKAALMNLLSIAAAYGVVTAIFEWGWGAELIGLSELTPVDSYIPMMLFAVLFGLSMDYEVFLLTSFREHWERTGDMNTAIRRGLADTGPLVTAAAAIMVVVFGAFILSDNATVKMFGVGLATAVLVDATIVRCCLVPAIMVLAQKGTWWLPGWLDRLLPHLHVEGDPEALDEISAEADPSGGSRPLLVHRPAPVIGAALGVLISWALVSRLPVLPPDARTPIAMSAVLAAVALLLPPDLGGGRLTTLGRRIFGYFIGVILGLLVTGLLAIVVPPNSASNGAITAWAIMIAALVGVLVIGRSLALPMVLGAIATAITVALMAGSGGNTTNLMTVLLIPALISLATTWFATVYFDGRAVARSESRAAAKAQAAQIQHEESLVSVGDMLSSDSRDGRNGGPNDGMRKDDGQ